MALSHKVVLDDVAVRAAQPWQPKAFQVEAPAVEIAVAADPQALDTLPEPVPQPEIPVELPEPDPELLDRAREAGYNLGLTEGRRQAESQSMAEREALRAVSAQLDGYRATLEARLAPEVLSLAIAMARQIVRSAIALNPEAILPVLREAVMVLPGMEYQVIVHLHPADAQIITPMLSADPVLAKAQWRLVEDIRMERGGCRLETPESEVDATVATRWQRVLAALGREESWLAESA